MTEFSKKIRRSQMFRIIFPLSFFILFSLSCSDPGGLEPVTGVQGRITFQGEWPDSIKAVSLIILDRTVIVDQDNIGAYIISYSNPVVEASDYFIQLKPGGYLGVLVGLLIDPVEFALNIETILASDKIPIVMLSSGKDPVVVSDEEPEEKDWPVDFGDF